MVNTLALTVPVLIFLGAMTLMARRITQAEKSLRLCMPMSRVAEQIHREPTLLAFFIDPIACPLCMEQLPWIWKAMGTVGVPAVVGNLLDGSGEPKGSTSMLLQTYGIKTPAMILFRSGKPMARIQREGSAPPPSNQSYARFLAQVRTRN